MCFTFGCVCETGVFLWNNAEERDRCKVTHLFSKKHQYLFPISHQLMLFEFAHCMRVCGFALWLYSCESSPIGANFLMIIIRLRYATIVSNKWITLFYYVCGCVCSFFCVSQFFYLFISQTTNSFQSINKLRRRCVGMSVLRVHTVQLICFAHFCASHQNIRFI